jgi:hypothetical protein
MIKKTSTEKLHHPTVSEIFLNRSLKKEVLEAKR